MSTTADTIAAYYEDLADGPQDPIRLATLRTLIDTPHDLVTETLLEMTRTGFVHLVPDSNRKALTDADHEAAIRIGGEDKHLLIIEPEYFED